MSAPANSILSFFEGGRDLLGRSHAEILALDDGALEARHDYIQWLFPLTEASRAVPGSPVLTEDDVAQLRESATAQQRMGDAAARMRLFYERTSDWLAPFDHNQLRITRIIRSLRLICGDAPANAFRDFALAQVAATPVNARSRQFWRES
jgi:hypothetical protein